MLNASLDEYSPVKFEEGQKPGGPSDPKGEDDVSAPSAGSLKRKRDEPQQARGNLLALDADVLAERLANVEELSTSGGKAWQPAPSTSLKLRVRQGDMMILW